MTNPSSKDSFGAKGTLDVGGTSYEIHRLSAVDGAAALPFSLKVLLENLIRTEDRANVTAEQIRALANWDPSAEPDTEIQFTPSASDGEKVAQPDEVCLWRVERGPG